MTGVQPCALPISGAGYLESLAARQATPFFTVGLAFTLSGFSNLAAARGEHARAARLAGAAARLCEADGVPPRASTPFAPTWIIRPDKWRLCPASRASADGRHRLQPSSVLRWKADAFVVSAGLVYSIF